MKKIAYIEIDTHAEIAENFMSLIGLSQKVLVDFYFSQKVLSLLDETAASNGQIFKADAKTLFSLLKGEKYDLVIIGTAHRYFNLFLKIVECFPTLIIAHNLNFVKTDNWNLLKNIFKTQVKFRLKLLLKEGLLLKNKVYEKARGLVVLDRQISSEKYHFLPLFYNEYCSDKKPDGIFRIVIPGAVSQKRRDYSLILKEIKKIRIEGALEFVFLGKALGKELEWIENFKIENSNINLVYFTEKVSQNIYDNWMRKADILWCPIQQKTDFFSVKEYYGLTKISGNIGDAIKYGKLAVFPKFYQEKYPFVFSEYQTIEKCWEESLVGIFKNYEKNKISIELEKNLFKFVENFNK